jgi:hypothetical protein
MLAKRLLGNAQPPAGVPRGQVLRARLLHDRDVR